MQSNVNHETWSRRRGLAFAVAAGALLCGLPACNTSRSPQRGTNPPGLVLDHPGASALTSKRFVVDPNLGGKGSLLHITGIFWGRLVDIYDEADDGTRSLQHKDYVIGTNIVSDGFDYQLERNPLTGVEELTILHPLGGTDGIPSSDDFYEIAFRRLDGDLLPVGDDPIDAVGVFTMIPRNAAVVIVFDDLLEEGLVNNQTVRVSTGYPPILPYTARVFIDSNHGDVAKLSGDTAPAFYSTRVIIDPTISEVESFQTSPPLAVNGSGLPASRNPNLANLAVRIPTLEKPGFGQEFVLRNPTGHKVATTNNGTVDYSSATLDVVRGMRSGGDNLVTGDPFNGFLRDEVPPTLISVQPAVVLVAPQPDPDGTEVDFILPQMQFLTQDCAREPRVGDVLRQTSNYMEVTSAEAQISGALVLDLKVRLLVGDPNEFATSGLGAAQYLASYNPALDPSRIQCFLQISPEPTGFPDEPTTGIGTSSTFTLRFSEPMDPASIRAFDSVLLTRAADPASGFDYVVATLEAGVDLQDYTLLPELPLAHVNGVSESYFISLVSGDLGPSDLAGNGLADLIPQIEVELESSLATQTNGGHVSRFSALDEEEPIGNDISGELPEWTGQHTYNLERQTILPRSVVRSEAVIDRTKPMVNGMSTVAGGLGEPLTKYGNRLQAIWRECDANIEVLNDATYNSDIEGLSWAPVGGLAIADHYDEFEIRLSHSLYLPDELFDPLTQLPIYPDSGLTEIFATNTVAPDIDPPKIVHRRDLGYTISPGDIVASDTGTLVLPFPLNRSVPASQFTYYTWRDTSLTRRGGPNNAGAEVTIYRCMIQDCSMALPPPIMSANRVESIGLPLLMEFRCYPDTKAQGSNFLDVSVATTVSTRPAFRAFSSGGFDGSGSSVDRDPDLEDRANGGFNPNSNPPGQATDGRDQTVYLGSIQLVSRISRSYSLWFETEGATNPIFQPALIEPRADEQPAGTSILVSYRGALQAAPAVVRENASRLDAYGDHYTSPNLDRDNPNPQITFRSGDDGWHDDPSEIDGLPFFQLRLTFLSNAETGVSPELSAIGLTWIEQ